MQSTTMRCLEPYRVLPTTTSRIAATGGTLPACGPGDDTLDGATGADTIDGDDMLRGGSGDERLTEGAGSDDAGP